jgi:uncharacterized protein (DUF488 family)
MSIPVVVWTIGHSNHSAERLVELLQAHGITAVADVRTSPYSAYSTQFNKEQLLRLLESSGIRYVFLGAELGGRPAEEGLYDADGHVRYDLVSVTPLFLGGIERLERGAVEHRIAVLCGEEDPISCHRRRLVGRVLIDLGVREAAEFPERFQLTWDGPPAWRSEHPVKRRSGGGEPWSES